MYDDGTYRKPGPTFNAVNDLEIKLAHSAGRFVARISAEWLSL
jgi:hypothetical protein